MKDDMLSQEEIDALLNGTADEEDSPVQPEKLTIFSYLSEMEIDALGEIGNISFGSSATALSSLLNQVVEITTPEVTLVRTEEVAQSLPHSSVAINVQYTEGLAGDNLLVILQKDAAVIADLMLGGDGVNPPEYLDGIQLSALQEAMNQMMGSAATSMSAIFNNRVDISPPALELMDLTTQNGRGYLPEADLLIKISFHLAIGSLIDSYFMQLVPLEFGQEMVARLVNESQVPEAAAAVAAQTEKITQQVKQEEAFSMTQQNQSSSHNNSISQARQATAPVNIQPAQFSAFENPGLSSGESRNLNLLLDIPLQVTVELGRTKRSVKEILELSAGSIIELEKLAGEPVDILVNDRLIAQGEVVVIEENFGVRLTDILSQSDRLTNLR
ncbi:flagellar motor switch phosphatase FliY [Jeotgalibacillus proteolyticus]|uniref:Flagellar motor switch phosphatase FliY n=1 Tax=Jeotgalibacillus proteolyticus TaxID=2082395 RepID=A0A2S5GG92_9BACL|nr:flagellar motor switch phosphatase FliY [Jeotgalibacillus proteolyticus]PPA72050.1 flagellar motor switch phosphatase FliY [Jeotgalibacillus proteolyticus]